jgi:hypothetical protein
MQEQRMSDAKGPGSPPRNASGSPDDAVRQAGNEVRSAAAGIGAEARQAAGTLREEATRTVEEVKAEGSKVAEAAQERALGFAEEQKKAGAEQAEGLARAVHRAADELQGASPQIARYVHEAAASVDGMARALRDRSPGELMGQVEDLARRQPVAFFGAAVLAGFALARFAKSSAEHQHHGDHWAGHRAEMGHQGGMGRSGGTQGTPGHGIATPRPSAMGAPGWVPEGGQPKDGAIPAARPATMAAATLGGAGAMPAAGNRTGPQDPVT